MMDIGRLLSNLIGRQVRLSFPDRKNVPVETWGEFRVLPNGDFGVSSSPLYIGKKTDIVFSSGAVKEICFSRDSTSIALSEAPGSRVRFSLRLGDAVKVTTREGGGKDWILGVVVDLEERGIVVQTACESKRNVPMSEIIDVYINPQNLKDRT